MMAALGPYGGALVDGTLCIPGALEGAEVLIPTEGITCRLDEGMCWVEDATVCAAMAGMTWKLEEGGTGSELDGGALCMLEDAARVSRSCSIIVGLVRILSSKLWSIRLP